MRQVEVGCGRRIDGATMTRKQAYGVYIWHKPQRCIWVTRMIHATDSAMAAIKAQEVAHKELIRAGIATSEWSEFQVQVSSYTPVEVYANDTQAG